MEEHYALSDDAFVQQFAACTLDPSLFSHEAHLRLAWIHLHHDGLEKAWKNIPQQLQGFVTHVGARDKYHHTLTIAAIHAVHHFMKPSTHTLFKDFIAEFPQLKNNFKALIDRHYSFDIFQSAKAKAIYIKPDKTPF